MSGIYKVKVVRSLFTQTSRKNAYPINASARIQFFRLHTNTNGFPFFPTTDLIARFRESISKWQQSQYVYQNITDHAAMQRVNSCIDKKRTNATSYRVNSEQIKLCFTYIAMK